MCLGVPGKVVRLEPSAGRHADGRRELRRHHEGGLLRVHARGRPGRLGARARRVRHQQARRGARPRGLPDAEGAGRAVRARRPAARTGVLMRFVDEYRREEDARVFVRAIRARVTRPWTLMEICGGQTHTLIRSGIDRMLPPEITLVHGPGCPVCVTPLDADRPGARDRAPPRRDLHLFRRHAARARLDDEPPQRQGAGRRRADGLLAARRGARSPSRTPAARSSSSPWASRPRRPRTPWR